MADYGLIQGIASGLREGVNSYRTERDRQDRLAQEALDRKMRQAAFDQERQHAEDMLAMQSAKEGLIRAPDGGFIQSPESIAAEKQKRDLDLFKIGAMEGPQGLQYRPEYLALQKEKQQMSPYQQAMLGLSMESAARARRTEEKEEKKTALGTEGERSAASYATRMRSAEKDLKSILEGGFDPTEKKQALMGYAPEMFKPENVKRFENAKKNFLAAVLRKESGAAISASEYAEGDRIYFPSPGDTPATLEQKARNRQDAMAGVELSAGPALSQIKPEEPTGFLPKQAGIIPQTKKINGVIYKKVPGGWEEVQSGISGQ